MLASSKTELADPASRKDVCLDSLGVADAQRTGHIFRAILSAWRSGKADSGCGAGDLAMGVRRGQLSNLFRVQASPINHR